MSCPQEKNMLCLLTGKECNAEDIQTCETKLESEGLLEVISLDEDFDDFCYGDNEAADLLLKP